MICMRLRARLRVSEFDRDRSIPAHTRDGFMPGCLAQNCTQGRRQEIPKWGLGRGGVGTGFSLGELVF